MSDRSSFNSSITQVASEDFEARKSDLVPPPDLPNTVFPVPSNLSVKNLPSEIYEYAEDDVEQYSRFSRPRKISIVCILSYCAFLAPISSTAILTAVPELAKTYGTTGDVINASNALYLAFMGIASPFWGALSQVWGRRPIFLASAGLFFTFTVATALSPNLPAYFVFRALAAFQGTSSLVVGSSAIGDIYEPRTRASALGWLVSASMMGPAVGPFLGGAIITYRPWRSIFWLLSAMAGLAALMLTLFLPETIASKKTSELAGKTLPQKTKFLIHHVSPLRTVLLLFSYPNLFLTGLTAGALNWNQYALLTPIRYILNPRFHLTTPIQAGLFYLVPAAGYLIGSFIGGRWADRVVRKYIKRRNGQRIPEDRLRASLPWICIITPACILIYGWSLDREIGGIALPVIAMFLQGLAQLLCLPSLNTYCLDVMQARGRSAEVVAGNYVFRYSFAALSTGVVLPATESLGVGWFSTISAVFLVGSGVTVWLTAVYGPTWRQAMDLKYERKTASEKEVPLDV